MACILVGGDSPSMNKQINSGKSDGDMEKWRKIKHGNGRGNSQASKCYFVEGSESPPL